MTDRQTTDRPIRLESIGRAQMIQAGECPSGRPREREFTKNSDSQVIYELVHYPSKVYDQIMHRICNSNEYMYVLFVCYI